MIATRQAFGETLLEVMRSNKKVLAVTADLGESLRLLPICNEMPERFVDVGVAESNMVGVSAGLALGGFVPVAGTFAVFMTRAYDHIRMQVCQNNLHVVLVGSHGGISNALDGGSAHALEDIAYMRTLPNMTIIYPADYNETKEALKASIAARGPVYIRLYREPTPVIEKKSEAFKIGRARVLRAGKDVSLIACGSQVLFALEAAQVLKDKGIDAEVINVHTIQPLDVKTIVASGMKTGAVVTVEDHSINGGLGSAVAEALVENFPVPMKRLGVRQFGESGPYKELAAKLGIDAAGIAGATEQFILSLR